MHLLVSPMLSGCSHLCTACIYLAIALYLLVLLVTEYLMFVQCLYIYEIFKRVLN